jgi:hypothetical protein
MQKENITLKKLSPFVVPVNINKESPVTRPTSLLNGKIS